MITSEIRRYVQPGAEYESSIPDTAQQRITKKFESGGVKEIEYTVNGEVVGKRVFFKSGEPEFEYPWRKGRKHGNQYEWYGAGFLHFAEPFIDGMMHGIAKQWDPAGNIIGTYTMDHGTGIDLWRCLKDDGSVFLSEVLYFKEGRPHGFEWRIDENQVAVCIERSWKAGRLHGIYREWNENGRLRRGFPQYYVNDEKVSKRQYSKACKSDPTLPEFYENENNPDRTFPPEIATVLQR